MLNALNTLLSLPVQFQLLLTVLFRKRRNTSKSITNHHSLLGVRCINTKLSTEPVNKVCHPALNTIFLQQRQQSIYMEHHNEETKSLDGYYYIIALLAGLFIGAIINRGFIYVPVGGVLGLLSAAAFLKGVVKGHEDVD